MINNELLRLMRSFPNSFMNQNGEFIAHKEANEYFIINNMTDDIEMKYKALEWLSRAAHKGQPFRSAKKNKEFRKFMLSGINNFLGTDFDECQIAIIYQELGNQVNRPLTMKFVESNYDFEVLEGEMNRE